MADQIRDRLRAAREQLTDARGRKAEAQKEVESAKKAFDGVDWSDKKMTEVPEFQAAERAVAKVGAIADEIADLQQAESSILKMLGSDEPASRENNPASEQPRLGWSGQRLLGDSDTYKAACDAGVFRSRSHFGAIDLGQIASREEAIGFLNGNGGGMRADSLPGAPAAPFGTPGGFIVQPDYRGIIQPLLRQLTLLDVLPVGTTDSNTVDYVQVVSIPEGAAETGELALKPELGLVTQDATAPVRTIAGWIKAARQAMDDIAGLASLINLLLPYEVRRRIEAQILAGDGEGQNLTGITNTTGIATLDAVTGDNAADAILKALTTVVLSDSDPNFVAVNPLTWQDLLLERTNVGGANTGTYLYGGPGMMAAPTIWGMTITPSRIIGQFTPLVGDSRGATLLVREGVNVKTSDSDQDDFVRNRVTVLAEARVALPVWRPSAFAQAAIPES